MPGALAAPCSTTAELVDLVRDRLLRAGAEQTFMDNLLDIVWETVPKTLYGGSVYLSPK